MPAFEVPGGKELLHCVAEPPAEERPFPDRAIQLAQDSEGGEVGREEDDETPDGAREMAAKRGWRATLERKPRVLDVLRRVVRGV